MEAVTTAMTTAIGFVTTILDVITTNPVLAVLFAGGVFVPLGIRIFKGVKRAAK